MFEQYRDVVGIDDLCEMLGIGKNSAYKLLNSGDIKSIRIGNKHRIPKRFIIDYIEQAC